MHSSSRISSQHSSSGKGLFGQSISGDPRPHAQSLSRSRHHPSKQRWLHVPSVSSDSPDAAHGIGYGGSQVYISHAMVCMMENKGYKI